MKRSIVAVSLVTFLAVLSLLLFSVIPQHGVVAAQDNNGTDRFTFEAPISGTNDCTGEFLSGIAKFTFLHHTTIDDQGGFHTFFKLIIQGKVVGATTGDEYVIFQVSDYHVNDQSCPAEITDRLQFIAVTTGPSANENYYALYHVTFNADCEPTTRIDNFTLKCDH